MDKNTIFNQIESNDRLRQFFIDKNAYYNKYFGNNGNAIVYINYKLINDFINLLKNINTEIFIETKNIYLFGNEYYTETDIRYIFDIPEILMSICVTNENPLDTIKKLELNIKQTYYNFLDKKMYYVGESLEKEFIVEEIEEWWETSNVPYIFKIDGQKVENIIFNKNLKDIIFNSVLQYNLKYFFEIFNIPIIIDIELDTEIIKYSHNLLGAKIIRYYFSKYGLNNFNILNDFTNGEYYKNDVLIELIILKNDILEINQDDLDVFMNYINNIKNEELKDNAELLYNKLLNAIKII